MITVFMYSTEEQTIGSFNDIELRRTITPQTMTQLGIKMEDVLYILRIHVFTVPWEVAVTLSNKLPQVMLHLGTQRLIWGFPEAQRTLV